MTDAKEIGGYFELEHFEGAEYYPDAYAFSLARTACGWFLSQKHCRILYIPRYFCASMQTDPWIRPFEVRYYSVGADFMPSGLLPEGALPKDAWMILSDYYGILTDAQILAVCAAKKNVLLDFTHSFFRQPPSGVDALCSIRKFFGVPDGAYLLTKDPIRLPEETDHSAGRFSHLLGRFEETASAHYSEMLQTAESYHGASPSRMSALTHDLLRAVDYESVRKKRLLNFGILREALSDLDPLSALTAGIPETSRGPFCYPLLVKNAPEIRKTLAQQKIYIPTYWKTDALSDGAAAERDYADNILALPCDQRYDAADMQALAKAVRETICSTAN